MIKTFLGTTALSIALACAVPAAAVDFGIVVELSGSGAPAGSNWRNGIILATDEINAAGGILGEQITLNVYDTQTDPQTSRALVQKAIDEGAYVILGTVFSGSTIVNMLVAQQHAITQITGSEAPSITASGNPYIFRSSFGAQKSMPKIVSYLKDGLGLERVAVSWINNEFGKGGRDSFLAEAAKVGLTVVVDVPSEAGQTDFAADVVRLKTSDAQAIFAYHTEEESARLINEIRKQGINDMPIIGETTLISPKVIQLAGAAVERALGHVGLSIDAPIEGIQRFATDYEARFGHEPDHNAIKGYISTYAVRFATEKAGKFDSQLLADTMHGLTITVAEEPNILMDVSWDENGEVSRESFLVEVRNGEQMIIGTLPAN